MSGSQLQMMTGGWESGGWLYQIWPGQHCGNQALRDEDTTRKTGAPDPIPRFTMGLLKSSDDRITTNVWHRRSEISAILANRGAQDPIGCVSREAGTTRY